MSSNVQCPKWIFINLYISIHLDAETVVAKTVFIQL